MRFGLIILITSLLLLSGCSSTRSYTLSVQEAQQALHAQDYEKSGKLLQSLLDTNGYTQETLDLAIEYSILTSSWEEALAFVDRHLETDPESAETYMRTKGMILEKLGRSEEAIPLYQELWEKDRYDSELGVKLIGVLAEYGDQEAAYETALTLYQYHPDLTELLEYLASFGTPEQAGWKEVLAYNTASR